MRSLKERDLVKKIMMEKGYKKNIGSKTNYAYHRWSRREVFVETGKCVGIVLVFSIYFYKSIWAVIPLCVLGIFYFQRDCNRKAMQDQRRLLLQFRDMIRSVASAMTAGYSVENAFLQSYGDMCQMHGKDAMICEELQLIQRGLAMNLTLEEMLEDLGKRSHVEQIEEFAVIYSMAKKNGGSMKNVIRSSSELIQKLVDTEEDILIQIAGRKMEQKIMNVMPFAILTYIGVCNKGYFDDLYYNVSGVVIMSLCLLVYLAACGMSEVILRKTLSIWN